MIFGGGHNVVFIVVMPFYFLLGYFLFGDGYIKFMNMIVIL